MYNNEAKRLREIANGMEERILVLERRQDAISEGSYRPGEYTAEERQAMYDRCERMITYLMDDQDALFKAANVLDKCRIPLQNSKTAAEDHLQSLIDECDRTCAGDSDLKFVMAMARFYGAKEMLRIIQEGETV